MARKPAADGSALGRAVAMLQAITGADRAPSLADLGDALGLPKATVHRIATALERQQLLLRHPGTKRFELGPRFLSLAVDALRNSAHRGGRRAIMRGLVDEIGETCNFTMLDGDRVVYIDRVEAHWPLRLHLQPGSRVPLHCTASGKLLLSRLRPATRKRLLGSLDLERHTDNTITDRRRLERALDEIRATQVGTDDEEFLDGLVAVAVPVVDARKRTCGALALHGPTARLRLEQALQHVPRLRAAAAAIAATLSADSPKTGR